MTSNLRQDFDRAVIGSRLEQTTLMIVRSFIGALTRDYMAKNEISLLDAHDMIHFRSYEEYIVDELFKPLRDKISKGKYMSLSDHEYYKQISKREYDKIFGGIIHA